MRTGRVQVWIREYPKRVFEFSLISWTGTHLSFLDTCIFGYFWILISFWILLDTFGYFWILSCQFWILLDTFLDTHHFWILLDTFGYFWILGFSIFWTLTIDTIFLDTFGYFWILKKTFTLPQPTCNV